MKVTKEGIINGTQFDNWVVTTDRDDLAGLNVRQAQLAYRACILEYIAAKIGLDLPTEGHQIASGCDKNSKQGWDSSRPDSEPYPTLDDERQTQEVIAGLRWGSI